MEVILAPNKINLLPTTQLVKEAKNKNKILTHPVGKITTNRKQTYIFLPKLERHGCYRSDAYWIGKNMGAKMRAGEKL